MPSAPSRASAPNVLLITIDTLRADHCTTAGYSRDTTPRLQRLARSGVSFERAYAPMANTLPSHATLFTSLSPLVHGVVQNGIPLPETYVTTAESFAARGYATAAFVGAFPLARRFGLDQGFSTYDDELSPTTPPNRPPTWRGFELGGAFERRADEVRNRAGTWMERHRWSRFFLWAHFFDPHRPYEPRASARGLWWRLRALGLERHLAREIRKYDEEILFVDSQVGALLDTLARLELERDTVVVVTADHGEGLNERGYLGHGRTMFEEEVRVPLVISAPGRVPEGLRVAQPVQLADVAPTLHELAGIAPLPGAQGLSLLGLLGPRPAWTDGRPIHLLRRPSAQGAGPGSLGQAVRSGRFKLIDDGSDPARLFDLESDPGETRDVAPAKPDVAERLSRLLRGASAGIGPRRPAQIPDDVWERLQALGYTR